MLHLIGGLLGGVLGIAALYLVFRRFLRLGSPQAGFLVALITLAIYLPIALARWPGGDVFAIHLAIYLITAYGLGVIGHRRAAAAQAGGKRWQWGPALIVGFFVVVIILDGIFITLADRGLEGPLARWLLPEPGTDTAVTSFFPGVIERDYQEKEAQFNAYLAKREAQAQRGWQVRKGWLEPPRAGEPTPFQIRIEDAEGRTVSEATIQGRFLRPSDAGQDQTVAFEEVEPGVYRDELSLPDPGRWRVLLEIRKDEAWHELRATTWVEPEDRSQSL